MYLFFSDHSVDQEKRLLNLASSFDGYIALVLMPRFKCKYLQLKWGESFISMVYVDCYRSTYSNYS